ncbi:hypothetical protein HYG77_30435 [Rhodococcus sp. ZPP]|nr:hypothetical protein [Rhodococcus sp. ZPP]QTJ69426.1 hypothetical protein HYG77_30435 [Rhodococcus sp. ZPP]
MLKRLYAALLTAAGLSCDGYITLDEAVSIPATHRGQGRTRRPSRNRR